MNVFVHECRANVKSLLIWCGSAIFLVIAGMGKYTGVSDGGQKINELIAKMPRIVQVVMGGGAFDLTTVGGYYGVTYGLLLLVAAVYALSLGAGIVAKEERDKTAEFLMTKPVSRVNVLSQKILATLVCLVLFSLAVFGASAAIVQVLESESNLSGAIAKLCVALLLFQLIFTGIGVALAAFDNHPKRAIRVGTILLFGTYFLSLAISLTDTLNVLRPLSPFSYFDTARILDGGALDSGYAVLAGALTIVLFCFALFSYKKRDLKI